MLFIPLLVSALAPPVPPVGPPVMAAPQEAPKPYSCGPCLLQPATDGMILVVDHVSPVPATLEWGLPGAPAQRMEHAEPMRHHMFDVTGLAPDSVYEYRITTGDTLDSGPRQFRTLPVAPDSYRIITVGDVRSQPAEWSRVSNRIVEHESDALFMIGTGDYPSNGRKYPQWVLQFFRPARDLLARIPIWPAIGNHEATRPAGSTKEENSKYFSLFELPGNEHWYRVDYHLLTLLIVDSNSHCDPTSEQYDWLLEQLRSKRARYTLVAFHHAPFTSGPHGKIHLDGTPREWPIDESQRFLVPLFEMYGVDLVLNGHDHLYERSEKNGLTYIVTGGGGAPLYKVNSTANRYQKVAQSKHHYVALTVDEEKIAIEAIDVQGQVFDETVIRANGETLQRRHAFIARELHQGLHLGAVHPATLRLPFTISNPLDHDLTFAAGTENGASLGSEAQLTLEPGTEKSAHLDLSWLREEMNAAPWQADVTASLQVALDGQDDALTIHAPLEQAVFLRRKHYPTSTDWATAPTMTLGPGNQIVKGATTYEGSADGSAQVRVIRSDTHLLVSLDVTDDQVTAAPDEAPLDQDGVHLLFAAPGDVKSAKSKGKVSRFSVTADGRTSTTEGDAPEWSATAERTDAGYSLQLRLPLKDLPLDKDDHLGLDILLSDRDGPKNLTHLRLWSPERQASNPSDFGFLHL